MENATLKKPTDTLAKLTVIAILTTVILLIYPIKDKEPVLDGNAPKIM